jgi:ABC-2 type transport system ATP-binding protein
VIELKNVSMSYRSGFLRLRKQVLDEISFKVSEGSIVGYLGVNGAGKTTTIKLISGINSPDSGEISVFGESPREPETRNSIGYLPENPYFYEYLTPNEALDLYGQLHGIDRKTRRARAGFLLERLEMTPHANRHVRGFSKGMRQRLGLAQALIHNPKLLILDEPLTGLDPMGRLLLREIILSEREEGRTVFFSSHVLSDVQAICDAIVILNGGQISYFGTISGLLEGADAGHVRIRFNGLELESIPGDLDWVTPPKKRGAGYEAELASEAAAQVALQSLRLAGANITDLRRTGVSLEDYFLTRFGTQSTA